MNNRAELIDGVWHDEEGRPTHKENGQLAPNHKWKMPAYKPGESGHTARFTPKRLANLCQEYLSSIDKRPTWAGLALHLGISRQALDKYRAGEIGIDKAGIVAVLEYYKTVIETELEQALTSKDHATAGVIFALKNGHGWRDEKHLSVDQTTTQKLQIILPNELNQRLTEQAGEPLGMVIEGECEQV